MSNPDDIAAAIKSAMTEAIQDAAKLPQLTEDDCDHMTPEQITDAIAAGQFADELGWGRTDG